jgi:hypothetical protein
MDASGADTTPPELTITSHADGITSSTPRITVTGTASDPSGIASVTVNGEPANGTDTRIAVSGEYMPEADIDENSCVNALDVLRIMQAAAGQIELWGCSHLHRPDIRAPRLGIMRWLRRFQTSDPIASSTIRRSFFRLYIRAIWAGGDAQARLATLLKFYLNTRAE